MNFSKQQAEYLIGILEKRKLEIVKTYFDSFSDEWLSDEGMNEFNTCCDMLFPLYRIAIKPIQVTRTITYDVEGYLDYCNDMNTIKPSQEDFRTWVESLCYDDFRDSFEMDFLDFKEVDTNP